MLVYMYIVVYYYFWLLLTVALRCWTIIYIEIDIPSLIPKLFMHYRQKLVCK